MTYIRYGFLGLVLALVITVALANREMVTLSLWPDALSGFLGVGYRLTLPLFVVVALAAGFGLVVGLVWEWLRERGTRAEAARARRAAEQAQAERPGGAERRSAAQDEVLAILEDRPGAPR